MEYLSQSDGVYALKRIALQVGEDTSKGWYRFQVNPNSYKHSKPQRVSIFKTKSNIITEDFGKDIEIIRFGGTTGFKVDKNGRTGKERLEQLEKFIDDYASQGGNGNRSKQELNFYNYTDEKYYVVHLAPEGLTIERNASRPLLFDYTLNFVVLRGIGDPPERDRANPKIGNENPSIGGSNKNSGSGNPQSGSLPMSYSAGFISPQTMAVNPSGTQGAYQYGVEQLKQNIGYGGKV